MTLQAAATVHAPVRAVVDGAIHLPAGEVSPKALELLRRELSFPNPEYVQRLRMGRWVGATPEEICLVQTGPSGVVTLPRGAAGVLRRALESVRQGLCFEDHRAVLEPCDPHLGLTLRDYQGEAVAALVRHTQGCAVLPCGSGKTVIGAAAIERVRQPALVLVHTHDLVDQWSEMLGASLGVDPGIVSDGRVEPAPITVATVQTLAALPERDLAELGRRFGTVLLDEAHHLPAITFRTVLSSLPAKYRFGLTATPERSDGLSALLPLCIGPIVFAIGHRHLVDAGHLVVPEVVQVQTGCAPDAETHAELLAALTADAGRNALLADLACKEAREGQCVLVLSGRVQHCHALARTISRRGVPAEPLTGQVPRRRRTEILDRFRDGDLEVLCATTLADEGLDVTALSRLILATPARAEGRTIQRLGRLMRPHPGKGTPLLFDLVDDHPMARRQHLARRRAYRKVLGDEAGERTLAPAQVRGTA